MGGCTLEEHRGRGGLVRHGTGVVNVATLLLLLRQLLYLVQLLLLLQQLPLA